MTCVVLAALEKTVGRDERITRLRGWGFEGTNEGCTKKKPESAISKVIVEGTEGGSEEGKRASATQIPMSLSLELDRRPEERQLGSPRVRRGIRRGSLGHVIIEQH